MDKQTDKLRQKAMDNPGTKIKIGKGEYYYSARGHYPQCIYRNENVTATYWGAWQTVGRKYIDDSLKNIISQIESDS